MKTKMLLIIGTTGLLLTSCANQCTTIPSKDGRPIHGKAHDVFSVDEEIVGKGHTFRQGFLTGALSIVRYRGELVLTTQPKQFGGAVAWQGERIPELAGMTFAEAADSNHLGLLIVHKDTTQEHTVAAFIHHK